MTSLESIISISYLISNISLNISTVTGEVNRFDGVVIVRLEISKGVELVTPFFILKNYLTILLSQPFI
jgi:hypothetical protein